jgi:hypothetical protein
VQPNVVWRSVTNLHGHCDPAFNWLDKAYDERASLLIEIGFTPSYDKIRNDRRFKALLQKIGIPH